MVFNEDELEKEIVRIWGEHGAHNEVFKAMRKQISEFKEKTEMGSLEEIKTEIEKIIIAHIEGHTDAIMADKGSEENWQGMLNRLVKLQRLANESRYKLNVGDAVFSDYGDGIIVSIDLKDNDKGAPYLVDYGEGFVGHDGDGCYPRETCLWNSLDSLTLKNQ